MIKIIALIAIPIFLFIIYALFYRSGKDSEREERMYLNAWRNNLARKDLVRFNGQVYHVESVTGDVMEISDHSDSLFVLREELWPVD